MNILNLIYMLIFTFIATIVASFLGALIGINNKKINSKNINILNSFTIGLMLGLIFFELINESMVNLNEYYSSNKYNYIVFIVIFISFLLLYIFHEGIHYLTHKINNHLHIEECSDHGHLIELKESKNKLLSYIIFLFSIILHNIPEGLNLGTLYSSNIIIPVNGIIISISIFLHNIIISINMTSNFKNQTKYKTLAIFLPILTSLFSFIFAILGFYYKEILSNLFTSIILAISIGSLLFVIFIELLPSIIKKDINHKDIVYLIIGILISAFLIKLA